jgi:hypothetical protein
VRMKRLLVLVMCLTGFGAFGVAIPSAALAADSTCTTHRLTLSSWSTQFDFANSTWDFQCGGANNEDWSVTLQFQWKDGSGVWHTFDCDNGFPCQVGRPVTGTYNGGEEHSGTNTWNIAGQLNCLNVRMHGVVQFYGGSQPLNYNSITYNIGC